MRPHEECLVCGGPLRATPEDYVTHHELGLVQEERPLQIELVRHLHSAFTDKVPTVIEAGTGIGKSYSYLLNGIFHGKRILVSTAKKSLQAQLIEKDLPTLQTVMPALSSFAAGYGKNNFVCKRRVSRFAGDKRRKFLEVLDEHPEHRLDLMPPDAFDKDGWKYLVDRCPGRSCKFATGCGYLTMRHKAATSQVVVVNHTLFANMLRPMGASGPLFGEFDTVIIDEAHKLAEAVRDTFSTEIKSNTLQRVEYELKGAAELPNSKALGAAWTAFFQEANRHATDKAARYPLGPSAERLCAELATTCAAIRTLVVPEGHPKEDLAEALSDARAKLQDILDVLSASLSEESRKYDNYLATVQRYDNDTVVVKVIPVSVVPFLKKYFAARPNVALLSATLAVNGDLTRTVRDLGLPPETRTHILGSPFDLSKQAVLYTPTDLPSPDKDRGDRYHEAIATRVTELIAANRGNAFILCTAKRDLEAIAQGIRATGYKHPLLVQGEMSPPRMLEAFRRTSNATLLGLKSFWEGVDIQGDKLSLVILTKFPFPIPDPVIEARKARLDNPGAAFAIVDLHEMILDLRQGAGRLIRSKSDKGVVALLDTRVHTKPYGKTVLRSLGFPRVATATDPVLRALTSLSENR